MSAYEHGGAPTGQDAATRIQEIRESINVLDDQLLDLLNRRAALSLEVGNIKALDAAGIPAVVFGKAIYEGKINLEELWAWQNA